MEAIRYREGAEALDDQLQRVDLLAAVKGGNGDRDGAESRDANPEKDEKNPGHQGEFTFTKDASGRQMRRWML